MLNDQEIEKHHLSDEKKISLLLDLLTAERKERHLLAKKIHSQCSNLAALKLFLELADRKFEAGTLEADFFKEVIEISKQTHEELRRIQYSAFPAGSSYPGLVSGLQNFIIACSHKYHLKMEFTCIFNTELTLSDVKEIAIYNICTELVELACLSRLTHISVRLELFNADLLVEVTGLKPKKSRNTAGIKKLRDDIQIKLLWQKAAILPGTNWEDQYRISFDCRPDKESVKN